MTLTFLRPKLPSFFNQNLLADFRARGGNSLPMTDSRSSLKKFHPPSPQKAPTQGGSTNLLDCLDPENHQKISVLFSSIALESPNFPSPCVLPWSVMMMMMMVVVILVKKCDCNGSFDELGVALSGLGRKYSLKIMESKWPFCLFSGHN